MTNRNNDDLRVVNYSVEWNIYGISGEISGGTESFETKEDADKFIKKLKTTTSKKYNLVITLREISTNQVIGRYKKKEGNVNFKHSRRIK